MAQTRSLCAAPDCCGCTGTSGTERRDPSETERQTDTHTDRQTDWSRRRLSCLMLRVLNGPEHEARCSSTAPTRRQLALGNTSPAPADTFAYDGRARVLEAKRIRAAFREVSGKPSFARERRRETSHVGSSSVGRQSPVDRPVASRSATEPPPRFPSPCTSTPCFIFFSSSSSCLCRSSSSSVACSCSCCISSSSLWALRSSFCWMMAHRCSVSCSFTSVFLCRSSLAVTYSTSALSYRFLRKTQAEKLADAVSLPGSGVVAAGLFYPSSEDADIIGHHVIEGLELPLDPLQLHSLCLSLFGPVDNDTLLNFFSYCLHRLGSQSCQPHAKALLFLESVPDPSEQRSVLQTLSSLTCKGEKQDNTTSLSHLPPPLYFPWQSVGCAGPFEPALWTVFRLSALFSGPFSGLTSRRSDTSREPRPSWQGGRSGGPPEPH
ncbi:hypothetical protein EYF80_015079 [Liparis tanakae]|uniref:Uncharacterized protein n=1 Tax=Liparis tanakae TaxID=230148 RepID=A0A4Z2IAH5_9TELE|nr:hypothetical protein EYF80_015079 [Liparis tanakae]